MASHRMNCRRSGLRAEPLQNGTQSRTAARGQSVEETFTPEVDTLPRPAGFGTEVSTATQDFQLIDEYAVPAKTLARLSEASASIESNGEVKISVAGTTFGPYTGAGDVAVPLEGGTLTEGDLIRIHHQSTDGSSTTTQAQVVVLEV